MSSERLQTSYHLLKDNLVFNDYPIHYAGATLFIRNDNDVPVTLRLQDSADGSTWNLLLFSTTAQAGLGTITVQEQAFVAIHFTTAEEFMRVSVTAPTSIDKGVFMYLAQYPPKGREPASY